MQTFTGRQFWPLDPHPEEVCIEDIAHSLALQCRFAGHCRVPYSVAEHSVRVAMLLRQWRPKDRVLTLMGLFHDGSEAYLVDVPRPSKPFLIGYAEMEALVQTAIWHRFGLVAGEWTGRAACVQPDTAALIKRADNVLLATEARDLMSAPPVPWAGLPEPLPRLIHPWPWTFAEKRFLEVFAEVAT